MQTKLAVDLGAMLFTPPVVAQDIGPSAGGGGNTNMEILIQKIRRTRSC